MLGGGQRSRRRELASYTGLPGGACTAVTQASTISYPALPLRRVSRGRHPAPLQYDPAPALVPAPGHEYLHHSNRLWPGGHILELLHDAQRVGVYFPFVAQLAADTLSRWFRGLAKCNTLAIPSGGRGVLLAVAVWPVGYFSAIVAHLGRII